LNLREHFCLSPSEIFDLFEPDGARFVVVNKRAIISEPARFKTRPKLVTREGNTRCLWGGIDFCEIFEFVDSIWGGYRVEGDPLAIVGKLLLAEERDVLLANGIEQFV